MPRVYRQEGEILVNNPVRDPIAAWRLCGNRKCKICLAWYFDWRSKTSDGDMLFSLSGPPECWSCRAFFRKGAWKDEWPTWVLHKTFDRLIQSAFSCYTCKLVRQAIMLDCPTSDHLKAIETRQSPVWILGKEGGERLRVEFGSWHSSVWLELASSPRGLNTPVDSSYY